MLFALFAAAVVAAREIPLASGLVVNIAGEDATFQEVPDLGKGKFLCLWSGDEHLAFVVTTHEAFKNDIAAFLAHTERGMKAEGARNIKMVEGAKFSAADGAEVRRYDATYSAQGDSRKQIYYMVRSATGYHSVVVTLLMPKAYDAVRARTDKVLATVKLTAGK